MNFHEYPWTFMDFHDQFQLGVTDYDLTFTTLLLVYLWLGIKLQAEKVALASLTLEPFPNILTLTVFGVYWEQHT